MSWKETRRFIQTTEQRFVASYYWTDGRRWVPIWMECMAYGWIGWARSIAEMDDDH